MAIITPISRHFFATIMQTRFERPIATEITPAGPFWPAEDYHQRYYDKNGHEPYCHVIPWATLRELGLVAADA